jgi:hypothetical protein
MTAIESSDPAYYFGPIIDMMAEDEALCRHFARKPSGSYIDFEKSYCAEYPLHPSMHALHDLMNAVTMINDKDYNRIIRERNAVNLRFARVMHAKLAVSKNKPPKYQTELEQRQQFGDDRLRIPMTFF